MGTRPGGEIDLFGRKRPRQGADAAVGALEKMHVQRQSSDGQSWALWGLVGQGVSAIVRVVQADGVGMGRWAAAPQAHVLTFMGPQMVVYGLV